MGPTSNVLMFMLHWDEENNVTQTKLLPLLKEKSIHVCVKKWKYILKENNKTMYLGIVLVKIVWRVNN